MIKNVIFDIGNVIAFVDNDSYFYDYLKANNSDINLCSKITSDNMWLKLDAGLVTYEEAINYYVDKLDDRQAIEYVFKHWPEAMQLNNKVYETIKYLKNHDYNVYFLTNINEYCFNYILNECDFIQLGDGYVASYEANVNKPDFKIFETLFNKFDLVPEECIYLDDNKSNYHAGLELGLHSIHFTDVETGLKQLGELLDVEKR